MLLALAFGTLPPPAGTRHDTRVNVVSTMMLLRIGYFPKVLDLKEFLVGPRIKLTISPVKGARRNFHAFTHQTTQEQESTKNSSQSK